MNVTRRTLLLAGGTAAVTAPGLIGLMVAPEGVEVDAVRDKSLWTTQAPPLPTFNSFEGPRKVDLVVVGGGYTGLSCAYYVKKFRPDWNVMVLDSHEIGSGASSRNSGAVYARCVGVDHPGFADRGLTRLREFIEQEEIDCDFTPTSTLMLTRSKREAANFQSALSPGEQWIPGAELNERINSNYYTGAVESPNYFKIQPAKLVAGHVQAVLKVGVELFERSPALKIEYGIPAKISTPRGDVIADHVMIATNAYTPRFGMYEHRTYPLHQYSLATRKLTSEETKRLGLDRWTLRFESSLLPVTFSLTPTGHFFVRMVLGYASFDSQVWKDSSGAKALAQRLFEQRYPGIRDLGLDHGWHGVTGHTPLFRPIAGVMGDGNVHISAAYNGLGIMPGHNGGYLSARRITGESDDDVRILTDSSTRIPFPGDYYRSMMLKPVMNLMTPV
ncbi:MAG: NAD(P)/FAD-dependent oxidoreductase [Pseudomonadales bacterium]